MLRPTRSRLVTDSDIVCALRPCNLIKTKSSSVQIVGIPGFAPCKASADWLTLGLWPRLRERPGFFGNVAVEWRSFSRGAGGPYNWRGIRRHLGLDNSAFASGGHANRAALPHPESDFAACQPGRFRIAASVPQCSDWHLNCLAMTGLTWPGTSRGDHQLRFPRFYIIN